MDEGEEVLGAAVVSGCEAPEVLEPVEATFDAVAQPVDCLVVRDRYFAGASRGDHRFGVHVGDGLAQVVVVIGPVGQYGLGAEAFEQGFAVRLSCRWPAVSMKRSGRPSVPQTM